MKQARQWFGVYLGKVSHTRQKDVWVRCKIPQVLGDNTDSNWARPMGFDSLAVSEASLPWEINDGDHTHPDPQGGETGLPVPNPEQADYHTWHQVLYQDQTWHTDGQMSPGNTGNKIMAAYTGEHNPPPTGPGPCIGTLVLVMFLGGDINHPCYMLTSQVVG